MGSTLTNGPTALKPKPGMTTCRMNWDGNTCWEPARLALTMAMIMGDTSLGMSLKAIPAMSTMRQTMTFTKTQLTKFAINPRCRKIGSAFGVRGALRIMTPPRPAVGCGTRQWLVVSPTFGVTTKMMATSIGDRKHIPTETNSRPILNFSGTTIASWPIWSVPIISPMAMR